MAASGTVELGGKPYRWSSPLICDLEEYELACGPLLGDSINTVKGRTHLAWLCLRREDPELTLKQVRELSAEDYLKFWPMVREAIPMWVGAEAPSVPPAPESQPGSSGSAQPASTGSPAQPEERAYQM